MRGRRGRLLGLTLVLVGVAGPAYGQAGGPLELSLEEAVALSHAGSEEVRIARSQRALAESQVVQTRAGALPQVNASVMYNRTLASLFDNLVFGPPAEPGSEEGESPFGLLPFGRPNTWIAAAQVAQPLYAGGRVRTGLQIAEHVRRAADLQVEEAEAEIALQVRTAYFQAVLANEFVAITEETYALADAQFRQVELFRRQGTASEFDLLRAQVERDNLEPNIIEARNARRLAELNLKRLANIPAEQPLALSTAMAPKLGDIDREALRSAVARRPALQALEEVVASRAGAVQIARSAYLPTLSATGNFAYQGFPAGIAPTGVAWQRDWSVGLQLSVPVFNGFRTRGQIQQASAELLQAELQRDQMREGLEVELEAALGEFEAARSQIEARRATVGQARQALELAELRFRTGLSTQLEVSNARLLLEQARVNEAQGLFNYINILARLERVSGGSVSLVDQSLSSGD